MKIEKDGDKYFVKSDNFVNLQESKDYFFIGQAELNDFMERIYRASNEVTKMIHNGMSLQEACKVSEWFDNNVLSPSKSEDL